MKVAGYSEVAALFRLNSNLGFHKVAGYSEVVSTS